MELPKGPAVYFPREGNPYWPLPPDYLELRPEGQRLARINSCRMVRTPRDAADSWERFKQYYLMPDAEADFDPFFFKAPIYASPPLHKQVIDWLYRYDRIAVQAPRGIAKSTLRRAATLWLTLCFPGIEFTYILAKDDFCTKDMHRLKMQYENNERIVNDFGNQKPSRGEGIWSNHTLTLVQTRALIDAVSIDGKTRGLRPDIVWVDDPERDESAERQGIARAEFREKTLRVVTPMMDEGRKLMWTGTYTGQGSFLHYVIELSDEEQFKHVSDWGRWYKISIPAKDTKGRSAWREKYTDKFLHTKEMEMGPAFFDTEYMGKPRSEEASPFRVHHDRHEYLVDRPDVAFQAPYNNLDLKIRYNESYDAGAEIKYNPVERNWQDWLNDLNKFIAVDYATSDRPTADYSYICVAGLDTRNDLWVLDGWTKQGVSSNTIANEVWRLCEKWRVPKVLVEAFSVHVETARIIRQRVLEQAQVSDFVPTVIPYRPPQSLSKADRIMSLEWRFHQGKIKYPRQQSMVDNAIRMLYHQTRGFTRDGRSLAHDDAIDSLSMIQMYLRGGSPAPKPPAVKTKNPAERMMSGEMFYEGTNIPLSTAVDLHSLTPEALQSILLAGRQRQELEAYEGRQRDFLDDEPEIDIVMPPLSGGLPF